MKKILTIALSSILCAGISLEAYAQISFSNQNSKLANSNFHSGVAIAITDVNGDRLDDIVRMDQGNDFNIEYQQPGGKSFTNYNYGSIAGSSQWMMCVGDVNNDGYRDAMAAGNSDGV